MPSQAQANNSNISLDGASVIANNYIDYKEPLSAATVESALLNISRDPSTCPTLTHSDRSAIRELVMGLAGLRQYNILVACDGPLSGRHGCLYVAGQGLFGESGAPKSVPHELEPFQRALLKAHSAASRGEIHPKLIDLDPVVGTGMNLLKKLLGADTLLRWGN